MEIRRDVPAGTARHMFRQKMVQGSYEPFIGYAVVKGYADAEHSGVNPGVCSAAGLDIVLAAQYFIQGRLKALLNGIGVILYLPAVEAGAVILNCYQHVAFHRFNHRSFRYKYSLFFLLRHISPIVVITGLWEESQYSGL